MSISDHGFCFAYWLGFIFESWSPHKQSFTSLHECSFVWHLVSLFLFGLVPSLLPYVLSRCDPNTCTDEYPRILLPDNSPSQSNLALTPEPAGWAPILNKLYSDLKGHYSLSLWNWYSNIDFWILYLITQDGPSVPDLGLPLPHAGWRWPVPTEASLHLYPQCSYGQHSGPCWCQHYRGQCWLLGQYFDWLPSLWGSNCIYCMWLFTCLMYVKWAGKLNHVNHCL